MEGYDSRHTGEQLDLAIDYMLNHAQTIQEGIDSIEQTAQEKKQELEGVGQAQMVSYDNTESTATDPNESVMKGVTNIQAAIDVLTKKGIRSIDFIRNEQGGFLRYYKLDGDYKDIALTSIIIRFNSEKTQAQNVQDALIDAFERLDDVEGKMSELSQEVTKTVEDKNNKFSICDGEGKIIAILNGSVKIDENGRIITASFNSAEVIPDGITIEKTDDGWSVKNESIDNKKIAPSLKETLAFLYDDANNLMSLCDARGNIICKLNSSIEVDEDGNIVTKAFDSRKQNIGYNAVGRTQFPKIDYNKTTFRWLDIGNSHSLCALKYLRYIAISQGVDLSNVAFCRLSRGGSSFNSWYNGYHDNDIESGDALTGNKYAIAQDFGELKTHIKGTLYNATTEQTENIDKDLTRSTETFYGTDTSVMRSLLKDNDWDLITIHQRYAFNDRYDESDGWLTDLAPEDQINNIGNSSCADKFVQILKTLCPKATIGYLFSLTPFGINDKTYNPIYNAQSLQNTIDTHNRWCNTMKKFMSDSGINLMIPCDSALQNLRVSSVANEDGENIVSRYGFNYDKPHTNNGVAAYTMAAVVWEVVFAPRFNKSIYGNTLTELPEDDLHSTTEWYVQPSFTDNNSDKVIIDAPDGLWNKPQWVGKKSTDGGTTWSEDGRAKSFVRVSASNRKTCQMAAIMAVNDMWKINNPDNVEL